VAAVPAATDAQTPGTKPSIKIADRSLTAGERARVTGRAPGAHGHAIALEHAGPSGAWTTVASGTVGRGDRYTLRARVPASGALRVTVQPSGDAAAVAAGAGASSNPRAVTVRRAVRVGGKRLHVKVGRRTTVGGRVAPRAAGLPVKLQVRRDGRWATLDRDTTGTRGRFKLRDRVGRTTSAKARVVTAGADGLRAGTRRVGRLNVYRFAHASWYGPGLYGGQLACGGTLTPGTMGVAHKSLPCGSKVTFKHGRRSVRVRVIDRGPYVGGREYDLTAATAQRLGFEGHGAVLATR
jgi:hypothetical protein